MVELKRLLKADIMKLKSTQMIWIHFYIPILGLIVFLSYYSFSPWDSYNKVLSYFQAVAIVFPILISIITSMISEQEYMAGDFQHILTNSRTKSLTFVSKSLLFLLLGLWGIVVSTIGFYIGFSLIDENVFPFTIYLAITLILLGSNIFQYNLHFFLSFRLSKSISIGVGIVESLIAALFITGMGDGRWPFFPSSWGVRFISSLLMKYKGANYYLDPLLNYGIIIGLTVTIISFIGVLIWFTKWEGKRLEE